MSTQISPNKSLRNFRHFFPSLVLLSFLNEVLPHGRMIPDFAFGCSASDGIFRSSIALHNFLEEARIDVDADFP